jgi:hypothetical protein
MLVIIVSDQSNRIFSVSFFHPKLNHKHDNTITGVQLTHKNIPTNTVELISSHICITYRTNHDKRHTTYIQI